MKFKNFLIFSFIKQDILLILRNKFGFMLSYVFFILIVFIFPLSFSYDSEIINYFLPVIIWIAIIISSLISIEYIYRDEYDNGFIDHLILSSSRLTLILYSKIITGWLLNGIPISIISFFIFYILTSNIVLAKCLITMLVPSLLIIHCLGCLGSIITIGLVRSNILLLIIIVPLLIPVLLLSLHALKFAQNNMNYGLQFILILFFLSLNLFLIPYISAHLLKLGVD